MLAQRCSVEAHIVEVLQNGNTMWCDFLSRSCRSALEQPTCTLCIALELKGCILFSCSYQASALVLKSCDFPAGAVKVFVLPCQKEVEAGNPQRASWIYQEGDEIQLHEK